MSSMELATRAADAARWQRRLGDRRNLRVLFQTAFSLLRYVHHQWSRD